MTKRNAYTVYGTDYARMAASVLEAAGLCADIPSKDACIALKPNLVLASRADEGATTHYEVTSGVIDYLQAEGYRNIVIAEGSWVGCDTKHAADVCGYTELARLRGVPFIDTRRDSVITRDGAGMRLSLCRSVETFDFLINLPVLKGHCQTGLTCALKNMKGLIPDAEKRRFHALGLHRPIACLNALIKQDFILVDAICGDLDFEEGGNPVKRDMLMGFFDPVLCDAYAAELTGYSVTDIPYIKMAEALGIGSSDTGSINMTELNLPLPGHTAARTGAVSRLAGYIREREACSACTAGLIHTLKRLEEDGALTGFNGKIDIGQGCRKRTGMAGVGSCASGYQHSLPGCPPKASEIRSFVTKVMKISSAGEKP